MIQKVHEVTTGVKLIGIHGKAGSGKDTICSYLHEHYKNVYREAFADSLKATCAAAFGVPLDFFHDPDMKEITDEFWGVSYRKMAQYLGTEMFRDNIAGLLPDGRSDFWIRRLTGLLNGQLIGSSDLQNNDFITYTEEDVIIVPDVRFGNETDWIESNGGVVIHIHGFISPTRRDVPFHSSESEISTATMYSISNTGTLEDLHEKVAHFAIIQELEPSIDISQI